MDMCVAEAPFFADLADAPPGGRSVWLQSGRARIRVALWNAGGKGTVFLLPGRTECIEKYGRAAGECIQRGYSFITVDWRGQGLADRALPDRMAGHVDSFSDYQDDLDAMLVEADFQGLPRPYFMIAHSMGGAIGLRALMRGLPFRAAVFSGPMWGISMSPWLRPVASVATALARPFRLGNCYAPSTGAECYVLAAPFEGNVLTNDREMWAYMRRQLQTVPDLALGGPTMTWLGLALRECKALMAAPAPKVPAICSVGALEKVVDMQPMHQRMSDWPAGQLDIYPDAEHELMMEVPDVRNRFFERAVSLFDAQG